AARLTIWILGRRNDARDTGGDNGVRAGWRFPMVHTRLEGDIQGRAPSALAGLIERGDFGMRAAIACVEALADDLTVANDDGADHWVRRRLSPPASGKVECPAHVRAIVLALLRRALVRHPSAESDAEPDQTVGARLVRSPPAERGERMCP